VTFLRLSIVHERQADVSVETLEAKAHRFPRNVPSSRLHAIVPGFVRSQCVTVVASGQVCAKLSFAAC
jgi:hypothetical protein